MHDSFDLRRSDPHLVDAGVDWHDLEGNASERWGPTSPVVRTWPTSVAEVRQGRVWGPNGAVLTRDDALLAEASCEFISDQRGHSIRRRLWLGPLTHRFAGPVATVAANYGNVYTHWMFDVLPRLELLSLAGWQPDDFETIVVNASRSAFQRESLQRLGVTRWTEPRSDGRLHVEAGQLVVPSVVGESGIAPPWACDFLRRTFLSDDPGRPTRRLYISRADASTRRVVNEEEVIQALEQFGFEPITLSGRTVAAQADLFASAELIVAPHGSSLANAVFATAGAALIEIYPRTFVNPCFWHLANVVGVRHFALFATPVPKGQRAWPGSEDMYVETTPLLAAVAAAAKGHTGCADPGSGFGALS